MHKVPLLVKAPRLCQRFQITFRLMSLPQQPRICNLQGGKENLLGEQALFARRRIATVMHVRYSNACQLNWTAEHFRVRQVSHGFWCNYGSLTRAETITLQLFDLPH